MKWSRDIFEPDGYRRMGGREYPGGMNHPRSTGAQGGEWITLILVIISVIAAASVIVNFKAVTAVIAVGIVRVLSLGFPVLAAATVIMILLGRLGRRISGRRWGW